jgi:hypothetical protein
MSNIESRPLAPLDARTKIAEADRPKVYDLIGKQLDYLVNGPGSYYPDGGRKSPQAIGEDIKRFKGQVSNLKSFVDDPASIIDNVVGQLKTFGEKFKAEIEQNQPKDAIELTPDFTPWSSDENAIDADRYRETPPPITRPIGQRQDPGAPPSGRGSPVGYVSRIRDQIVPQR